jgi:hypothetical protein
MNQTAVTLIYENKALSDSFNRILSLCGSSLSCIWPEVRIEKGNTAAELSANISVINLDNSNSLRFIAGTEQNTEFDSSVPKDSEDDKESSVETDDSDASEDEPDSSSEQSRVTHTIVLLDLASVIDYRARPGFRRNLINVLENLPVSNSVSFVLVETGNKPSAEIRKQVEQWLLLRDDMTFDETLSCFSDGVSSWLKNEDCDLHKLLTSTFMNLPALWSLLPHNSMPFRQNETREEWCIFISAITNQVLLASNSLREQLWKDLTALSGKFIKCQTADAQIIIHGSSINVLCYQAFCRTLFERWPIRYPASVFTELTHPFAISGTVTKCLQIKDSNGAYSHIRISLTPDNRKETHAPLSTASSLINAKKYTFIWIVPEEWLDSRYDSEFLTSPIYPSLLDLSELTTALKLSDSHSIATIHFMELQNRPGRFGLKPWPSMYPENDEDAEKSINRRVPNIFFQIRAMADDLRFHVLPWSENGSHLDMAPLWIDSICNEAAGGTLFKLNQFKSSGRRATDNSDKTSRK